MFTKRIIPCLDVKDGVVVKGIKFKDHRIIGEVTELAKRYRDEGADELVFYDITASSDSRVVDKEWIKKIAEIIDIPFTVAGGIRSLQDAKTILNFGADKISINSPALENPNFITELADIFGTQCVVIGMDSRLEDNGEHFVYLYSGDQTKTVKSKKLTFEWIEQVQKLGAGEIVLNCIDTDGVCEGYDILQISRAREICKVPLIASGGAGKKEHFAEVLSKANADGALAATVFHDNIIPIPELKSYLSEQGISIRNCIID